MVELLPSYIQDTPHILRMIEDINSKGPLPKGTIPITLDVTALYHSIPHEGGILAMKEFLRIN